MLEYDNEYAREAIDFS